jgi:glycosyltransferase involved in cell wall biosynthesis
MACGTPVIAFPEGSASELVLDGETGFVVGDEHEMAAAVERLDEIDPEGCRASARERFDVSAVAEAYERAYEAVSSSPRSTDSVR